MKKNLFLIFLCAAIALARLAPWLGRKGGPLAPQVTVKYGAVAIIFVLSGLSLHPRQLTNAAAKMKLHALVQLFTFCLVPFTFATVVEPMIRRCTTLDPSLRKGLIVVACMPPPVSSAVILTKAAGGNEAAAIFNAALGSVLGVVVTPVLLVSLLDSAANNSSKGGLRYVFVELALTILLPLAVGQFVRPVCARRVEQLPTSAAGQFALLLIIYTTFCDSFYAGTAALSPAGLAATVLLVVVTQALLGAVVFFSANRICDDPADVICALFSATHKSLTLGVPIMRLVFADHPAFPQLSAPLLTYHPAQILLGGLLVPLVKNWLMAQRSKLENDTLPLVGKDVALVTRRQSSYSWTAGAFSTASAAALQNQPPVFRPDDAALSRPHDVGGARYDEGANGRATHDQRAGVGVSIHIM